MSNLGSIDNLLHPSDNDESASSKFEQKQKEIKLKEIERIAKRKAEENELDYIDLNGFPISPEALGLLLEDEARDLKAVCFFYNGRNIRLACLEETEEINKKLKELESEYHADTKLYLISKTSFDIALEAYKRLPKIKKYQGGVEIKVEDLEKFKQSISSYKNLNEKINEVNISDVITLIIATALKLNASDVHIEAENKKVIVRLRLDGVLQDAAEIDKDKWERIVSRLKILAEVKINVSNKPQDGRFTIHHGNRSIDVRSSFLPTAYGESVVMRILDSHTASL
jgi:type IV pilus assembly protein PilB